MTTSQNKPSSAKPAGQALVEELEAASPPGPSRSAGFSPVHEELLPLANIARVLLQALIDPDGKGGRRFAWGRFTSDSTPHRKITKEADIRRFLEAKLGTAPTGG